MTFGSFLLMAITGIVLYLVPQGRVAYWVDWKLLNLTKTDWGNIHIIAGLVFGLAGLFHLYNNWRVFMNYLTRKVSSSFKYKKELSLASVLTLFLLAGSIYPVPPLNYILDFSEYLKQEWVTSKEYEPPFGHAEDVSLKVLANKTEIELAPAVAALKAHGIIFISDGEKVKDIAKANNTTPMDMFVIMKQFQRKSAVISYNPELVEEKFAGTGIGWKQLGDALEETGIDPVTAQIRLASNNLQVQPDEIIKNAASRYHRDPLDLMKVILVDGYMLQ
jgi:hypothetical protein